MSQTGHRDIEGELPLNDHGDHPRSPLNQPPQPQGDSNSTDSAASLFSVYYTAADIEDNKMVESWQKDADGILFFTGLFSAAVAALLAVTVQDLRPSSQDASAFYLGNIYEVLANPNTTRASFPSPSAKLPPFSPPSYAIWVNSLWFLSLVISVSCALLATSLQQWARRYIKLTQPALCSPEKRARMHAFFAEGADRMHISWAVEVLPTLLHVSVFLFFGGLVVFLINVDHRVFSSVVWWIGLFTILYGSITLMPIVRHDSPYCAPLSRFAWFLFASTRHVYIILASKLIRNGNKDSKKHFRTLKERYRSWMSEGVEKAAEEMMLRRSSKIGIRIFDWTISALGDDKTLEEFFEAIPGFFNSEPMKNLERDFPETLLKTFWVTLNEFMGRTSSFNSVAESDKSRRATICRNIMNVVPCPNPISYDNLRPHLDRSPLPTWSLQAMTRWFTHTSRSISDSARIRATELLPSVQKRDEYWIAIASNAYSLSRLDLQDMISLGGNNVLLSILIVISRRTIQSNFREWEVLTGLTRFDILDTLPLLQHDFCALWNDIVQEARNQGSFKTPCDILHELRHLYLSLHRGTDAAPTAFSATTDDLNHVLFLSSSYPFCNIASHRPRSTFIIPPTTVPFLTQTGDSSHPSPHQSIFGGSATLSLSGEANIIAGPPWPSVPSSPLHIDASPPSDIAAAIQNILSTAKYSRSPEDNQQEDIVASNNAGISPTMPIPTRVSASGPPVPNTTAASWDAKPASTSNSTSRTPHVIGFPVPVSYPSSQVSPPQSANLITLLSGTAPSHLADNYTTRRLRALGVVNSGNKFFASAVLQLLVHCPPFWGLLKDRGKLFGQQGLGEGYGQETGGGATPLVDATIKFLNEFLYKETPSVVQQPQEKAGKGKSKEDEERKGHDTLDSHELTYIYDVMKEKRQLNSLLGGQRQDAAEFLDLYLEALDEELVMLQTSMSTLKPAPAPKVEGLEEENRQGIGRTEVGGRNYTVRSPKSPISRMFGGRSRSIVNAPNQPDITTIEEWRLLQINIQPDSVHTIEDALAHIFRPQPGQIVQSSSSDATRHMQIETLPPVLVLHMKRFLHDAAVDRTIKISKPVHFTPELEISPDIMASVPGAEPAHYKLYGVLYCHGESTDNRYYSVDVIHPIGDGGGGETWLHIDDEAARTVRHKDVFSDHDNERVDDRCAYMLLYCRADRPYA